MINQKDVKKPAANERQNQHADQRQDNARRQQGFQAQPGQQQGQNQSQQNKDQKNLANKPGQQQPGKDVRKEQDSYSSDKSRPQQPDKR